MEANTLNQSVFDWLREEEGEYTEDYTPEQKLSEVIEHGCQSGVVGSLIYYTDTVKFYHKHHHEIGQLVENLIDSTGLPIHEIFGDKWDNSDPFANDDMNQNLLAWFAFEESASIIYDNELWVDEVEVEA